MEDKKIALSSYYALCISEKSKRRNYDKKNSKNCSSDCLKMVWQISFVNVNNQENEGFWQIEKEILSNMTTQNRMLQNKLFSTIIT